MIGTRRWSGRHFLGALVALALVLWGSPRPAAGGEPPGDGPRAGATDPAAEPPVLLVGSTMLGSAVADLAGFRWQIRTLVASQACPGHFDVTPRVLGEASQARLVLVHDYQKALGERLRGGDPARDVAAIPTSGAQTMPEHYLDLCRRTAAVLIERFPSEGDSIAARLRLLETRIPDAAARELGRARARVAGRSYLVARMQSDFVVWAGGKPAALFEATEDASLRKLGEVVAEARRRRVAGVVGNLQWGDRDARVLARELKVPWTLLSNYPEESAPGAWLRLLRANVDRLAELAGDE